jgi:hypothetical protein
MNPIESEIYLKLKEAEYQAASVKKRYTHNETMTELKNISLEGASPHPHTLKRLLSQPTPRADALLGAAASLGDITLEQIRDERLAKHLK